MEMDKVKTKKKKAVEQKKRAAMDMLSDGQMHSTTELANWMSSNHYMALRYLNLLRFEKKIEELNLPKATYWKKK